MKYLLKSALVAAGALVFLAGVASAQPETDHSNIERVLQTYETALNASDTDAVVALYAPDGVFMPQYSPSQVGAAAIRGTYEHVFETISLDIEFEIVEIRLIAPDWAFARTNSAGFVALNATGESAPEANQELFIFQKSENGDWQIARYIFSTTNPPRQ